MSRTNVTNRAQRQDYEPAVTPVKDAFEEEVGRGTNFERCVHSWSNFVDYKCFEGKAVK